MQFGGHGIELAAVYGIGAGLGDGSGGEVFDLAFKTCFADGYLVAFCHVVCARCVQAACKGICRACPAVGYAVDNGLFDGDGSGVGLRTCAQCNGVFQTGRRAHAQRGGRGGTGGGFGAERGCQCAVGGSLNADGHCAFACLGFNVSVGGVD